MSPGPIQLDQATALTLMLGPNGSVGIQARETVDGRRRSFRDWRRLSAPSRRRLRHRRGGRLFQPSRTQRRYHSGAANLRLPRFLGEGRARDAIMFDRRFSVESPEAKALINEVHPPEELDAAVESAVQNAVGSGMVSASGNRKAIRGPSGAIRHFPALHGNLCARAGLLPSERTAHQKPGAPLEC